MTIPPTASANAPSGSSRCHMASLWLGLLSLVGTALAASPPPSLHPDPASLAQRLAAAPLLFEANRGQAAASAEFVARTTDGAIVLRGAEARLTVWGPRATNGEDALDLRIRFRGVPPAVELAGRRPIAGGSSYFLGNDPRRWLAAVPTFEEVVAQGVYPGIDLVYRGQKGRLEFDLEVHPGADPRSIALAIDGAERLEIDDRGDLLLRLGTDTVRLHAPRVYQDDGDARRRIEAGYVHRGGGDVGFALGAYDHDRPLVIDPVIEYATPLGGAGVDNGVAIAVTSAGEAVIAGSTRSTDFPTTAGVVQPGFGGAGAYAGDLFVAKLSAAGTSFQWVTYLGGSKGERGSSVAVDAQGNVYVAGDTESTDFPTVGAFQDSLQGTIYDAVLAKIAADGGSLVYSTYFGGNNNDFIYGLVVDGTGSACVTGATISTNLPIVGGFQASFGGRTFDAFIAKFAPSGASLTYSSYLGGNSYDIGSAIAIDSGGNLYVTGTTFSTNFPTKAALQATAGGGRCGGGTFYTNCSDAFVTKVDPSKTAAASLVYSTFLGGTGGDYGNGIAVDGAGQVVVVGSTISADFPTLNPVQGSCAGYYDAFVTRLNAAGSGVVSSTYLGGADFDEANAVALSGGGIVVVGVTESTDFPTVAPIQPSHAGGSELLITKYIAASSGGTSFVLIDLAADGFIARVDAAGAPLTFSSFLGGAGDETVKAIAADGAGRLYLAGETDSADFPFAAPAQPALGGGKDAWAARLAMGPVVTADVTITKTDAPDPVTVGATLVYTLRVSNKGPDEAASVRVVDTVPAQVTALSASSSRGGCSVSGATVTCDLGNLARNAAATITISGTAASGGIVTNTASVAASAVDPSPADNSAQATTTIAGTPGSLAVSVGASSTSGVAPLTVSFNASASGGTPPYTYEWDFGDGSAHTSGAAPSHTFTTAGSFVVTAKVTDALSATATATATIAVSFPASPYVYLIPGIAHAPGAGNTQWRSAVAAVNRSGSAVALHMTYYSDSETRYASASLGPGGAAEWTNILENPFGFSLSSQTSGSLLIGSSAPLYITARTFNQTPTGTYGQYLPALTGADAIAGGATGVLPQLRRNAAFRSNVGGVNLGSQTCTVEVKLFGSNGAQVGSTKTLTIEPRRWKQQYDIFADVHAGDQDIAYAAVTVQPGGALAWVYASVVDAATGDPTTIPVLVATSAGGQQAAPADEPGSDDPLVIALSRELGVPVHRAEPREARPGRSPGAALKTEPVRVAFPGLRRLSPLSSVRASATNVILEDGFEGAFPGATWTVYDETDTGWGTTTYRASAGQRSAWCAAGGDNPGQPGGPYQPSMSTWMEFGPFSLADASAAQVTFDLWLESESEYDYLYWLVSSDAKNYTGYRTSGDSDGWMTVTFDLAGSTDPVILGQPQVYFALLFESDKTNELEGAYIDSLRIEKSTAGPSCSVTCSATAPTAAAAGAAVPFAATATPTGCSSAPSYDWSFGDGSSHATTASASHTYAAAGTYTWTLTVTVDSASCTKSGTVTVTQPATYLYVIPAVAHNAGSQGSQWRTDVAAVSLAGTTADIGLSYLASQTLTAGRTLPAGATVEWRNLVETVFGLGASAESSGTLHVSSSVPLFLTARTYNQGAAGTFGQYLPALTQLHAIPAGKVGVLPQLKSTSAYRTNLGLVNLGPATCTVAVSLYDENGAQVGSTRTITVEAGRWYQRSDIFGYLGAGSQDVAYATVEVQTAGGAVWAYGSVADNVTSDPTTIPVLVH